MKTAALLLVGLLGLALLVGLTLHYGLPDIAAAVARVGWGIALVVLARAIAVGAAGLAWRLMLPADAPAPLGAYPLLRFVREGINTLMPVAQVGGEVVGARLLAKAGVPGTQAGAGVLADMLVQAGTQVLFTLLGLGLLVAATGHSQVATWVGWGLAAFVPALLGFFLVQRLGLLGWVERQATGLAARGGLSLPAGFEGTLEGMGEALVAIYRRPRRLLGAALIHAGIWLFGSVEVWVTLHALGQPVTVAEVLALESLSQAVRGAFFVVPGGLGVQEGGLVALCALYGLSPQDALALSLVKRAAEIVVGLPGLGLWYGIEAKHLRSKRLSAQSAPG